MKRDFLTANQIAEELDLSPQQVRWLARKYGLGKKYGFGAWEFSQADLAKMKARPPLGRRPEVER